ncbi:MAG: sigma-54-dependent Fis family transcriptional regulator, partial [Thermodesulfovibrionia bacterium]|nr:sigma-54-dependent Fis family transcriptional regulator [Thermodesulfovibrionia bacterium]
SAGAEALMPLREQEMETIIRALRAFKGNKSKAAKALGITRKALYNRLSKVDKKLIPSK